MSIVLKTAFSTGPGFYAASTSKSDKLIPPGVMRFYIARIEAYDGDTANPAAHGETQFKLLIAMTEDRPDIARALLNLHHALGTNLELLRLQAKL